MWEQMWEYGIKYLNLLLVFNMLMDKIGSPVRIRTSIDGVRVRSLTVRRPGSRGGAYMLVPVHGQVAESGHLRRYSKMLNF